MADAAAKNKSRTCFVSAPIGVDTSLLTNILDEKGVAWSDASSASVGESALDDSISRIRDSDFICACVPKVPAAGTDNLIFEIGAASALGKPILLFVAPGAEVPLSLRHILYSISDLRERQPIAVQLEAFLNVIQSKKRVSRTVAPPKVKRIVRPEFKGGLKRVFDLARNERGNIFEDLVAQVFSESGTVVSQYRGNQNDQVGRPDLAVWISELSSLFGNPILIECKIGHIDKTVLLRAEQQLQRYIVSMGTLGGLVVYANETGEVIPQQSISLPLVLWVSFEQLVTFLDEGRLAERLAAYRNQIAHGRGVR